MEIQHEEQDGIEIIGIEGRLDASTSSQLEEALMPVVEKDGVLAVVDLRFLEYISSAGLRVMLSAAKAVKKNKGRIAISSLNANVNQVFEISGFASIFDLYETRQEAIDALKG